MTNAEAAAAGIKLRESCDSCLTAKVKCNKGRPVCQRCLTNGHDCQYSPSARAGRKNRNGVSKASSSTTSRKRPASIEIPPNPSNSESSPWTPQHPHNPHGQPVLDPSNSGSANQHNAQVFANPTPPLSREDQRSDAAVGEDKTNVPAAQISERDGLDHQMPTPPFNNPWSDPFFGPQAQSGPVSASTNFMFPGFNSTTASPRLSLRPTTGHEEWMVDDPSYAADTFSPFDMVPLTEVTSFHTDLFQRTPKSDELPALDGLANKTNPTLPECDCFAGCLHALQQLHDNSWSTPAATQGHIPFTVILDINREALKSCLNMMKCVNCSTKSGSSISTMLIATVLGKIISLYRVAVNSRDRSTSAENPLVLGSYTVTGEDKYLLENEILLVEVNKVRKAITMYQATCTAHGPDYEPSGIYDPIAMYLDNNLSQIVEFLQSQRDRAVNQ